MFNKINSTGFDTFLSGRNSSYFSQPAEFKKSSEQTSQTAYANPLSMEGSIFSGTFGGTASAFDA